MTFPLPKRGFYLECPEYICKSYIPATHLKVMFWSPHIMHLLRSAFLNASAPTVEATRASFQPFEAVLLYRARQKFMYFMLYIRVVIVQNF
ncbi:hypothetical protein HMPREF2958_04570 [Rothia sp. HMSC036D11]|nr:hypothetical protein HMPREF2958_04570 [Rothia sp. HMSC036D11]